MTLPSIDTITNYGGALTDYGGSVTDPTTDRPAGSATSAGSNQAYASVAAMTHTAPRCFAKFVGAASAPATPTVYNSNWHQNTPTAPTMSRTGTGVFRMTWPATVTDELGGTQTINFRFGIASAEGGTFAHPQVSVVSANVLQIDVLDAAGAHTDAVGVIIVVLGF